MSKKKMYLTNINPCLNDQRTAEWKTMWAIIETGWCHIWLRYPTIKENYLFPLTSSQKYMM